MIRAEEQILYRLLAALRIRIHTAFSVAFAVDIERGKQRLMALDLTADMRIRLFVDDTECISLYAREASQAPKDAYMYSFPCCLQTCLLIRCRSSVPEVVAVFPTVILPKVIRFLLALMTSIKAS